MKSSFLPRRAFVGGLAASVLTGFAPAVHSEKRGRYADSMSFLPENPDHVRLSGLDLFIADVSRGKVDTHPNGHTFYHRTFELCDQSITEAAARIRTEMPDMQIALSDRDLHRKDKVSAIFQFQGCEPIGRELSRMQYFRDKGLRILQLTHNESNMHATAYTEEQSGHGLTRLGIDGIAEMNRIGLIPHVSHASEASTLEAVYHSKRPVILSHGSCRTLLDHPRAATDRMIRAVTESGGIFGVFMMSFWLTNSKMPKPEHYTAHIRYAVNVAGIDSVGIANDYPMEGHSFNGAAFDNANHTAKYYGSWWTKNRERGIPGFGPMPAHAVIPEFNTLNRMERIHEALLKSGFKPREVDRIMGDNWTRFFMDYLR